MIQGLLAVVVGIVANALMYSFSCKFGNTKVLMVVAFFYWLATLTVGKGSSSLCGLGLLMGALAPFALFKFCLPDTPEAQAGMAIGLWGGIRALLIAVVITVIMEFVHVPGMFTRLSRDSLDKAFVAMEKAFTNVWNAKEAKKVVDEALGEVSGHLGDAETYNGACKLEPRLWKCAWKGDFLVETSAHMKKIRLDVLLIKKALCGIDGKMEEMVELINKVPEVEHMKKDLDATLVDAHELAMALLDHENGKFNGLDNLDTVEGLDELDGYDEAIVGQSKVVEFPAEVPETMENDALVRISIVYCMLEYLISHVSAMLKGSVKLS